MSERPLTAISYAQARRLVDLTWQHVTKTLQVASRETAHVLIEAAILDVTPVSRPGFDESWRDWLDGGAQTGMSQPDYAPHRPVPRPKLTLRVFRALTDAERQSLGAVFDLTEDEAPFVGVVALITE